jgi:hypothetical protein
MKMMKRKHGQEEKDNIEIMDLGTIVGAIIFIKMEDTEEILLHMVDGQLLTLMAMVIGTVQQPMDQDQVKQREIQMDLLKKTLQLIVVNQQLKQMRKTFRALFKLTQLNNKLANF